MFPESGTFKITVKAGRSKNKIVGYNEEKDSYIVEIKEKAENNKANIEILKFLKKTIGKEVKIIKGLTSKEKVIRIIG
jgi:uncharacterized protein (TIGR00251 family)